MNVVAIGAHPDDIEIGLGGTLARHVKEGDRVYILHMVNTGYNDPIKQITYRTNNEAQENAQNAANIIGADLHMLNFKDRQVPFNDESVVLIDRFLKKYSIDVIYTHWKGDSHQDHINTYNTVMAAARYADNIYLFEQIPLPRVSVINVAARYYVDITDFLDIKLRAVNCYKSEIRKYGSDLIEGIESLARYRGIQCNCKYAEAFELVKSVRRYIF
ncbi:MAG: PIG-L deacetylase family protein [Candidatus Odinarchaeia archaeon]